MAGIGDIGMVEEVRPQDPTTSPLSSSCLRHCGGGVWGAIALPRHSVDVREPRIKGERPASRSRQRGEVGHQRGIAVAGGEGEGVGEGEEADVGWRCEEEAGWRLGSSQRMRLNELLEAL